MLLKRIIGLLILSVGLKAHAQNLVSNGDFEIYTQCPNFDGQINFATGWLNADSAYGTPDYCNSCAGSPYNVPAAYAGYQQDCCLGNGFAGIYTFNYNFPNNGREYIQTKLADTLKSGKKYLASMYVNNCNMYNYAIATLGMYFTSTPIQGPATIAFINIPNPQVKNTTLLNDTVNWMLVQDTVIGTGTELYLTIGNFSYDSLSDTSRVYHMGFAHNNDYAYYYIDKVSVMDVATIGINDLENRKVEIEVYPNPNRGNFTLEYYLKESATIEITDVSGKLVGKYNLPANSNKMQITNEQVENGVYLYRIVSNGNLIKTGKIIVMK